MAVMFESKSANNRGYWALNLKDESLGAAINAYGGTFINYDPSSSATENPGEKTSLRGLLRMAIKTSAEPAPP